MATRQGGVAAMGHTGGQRDGSLVMWLAPLWYGAVVSGTPGGLYESGLLLSRMVDRSLGVALRETGVLRGC